VDRADDSDVPCRVELDGAQLPGVQQSEVKSVAGRRGQHVVCDIVVVKEKNLLALLGGDLVLGKDLPFWRIVRSAAPATAMPATKA
jgi:hypothetical protein